MAKEHFSVSKSGLTEILEQAYFPLIDCQEHADLYNRLDMAIKQQHEKLHDTLIIELTALTQIMHGLNDQNQAPENQP